MRGSQTSPASPASVSSTNPHCACRWAGARWPEPSSLASRRKASVTTSLSESCWIVRSLAICCCRTAARSRAACTGPSDAAAPPPSGPEPASASPGASCPPRSLTPSLPPSPSAKTPRGRPRRSHPGHPSPPHRSSTVHLPKGRGGPVADSRCADLPRRPAFAGVGGPCRLLRAPGDQAASAVARVVDAIVAEPTTRVPSYSTIAWPGATPRTGSVKDTSRVPSTSSARTSVSPPWARSWAV